MPDKSFEHVIPFHHVPTQNRWFPLVTVTLIRANGQRVDLPLIFDTGATVTTLRHDLFPLLDLTDWNVGQPANPATAGGVAQAYLYNAKLEFLGRAVVCPVSLMQLPPNPLWMGLLGRRQVFDQFGFGFWESAHEIYVTLNP
jgi:hypothetical protein